MRFAELIETRFRVLFIWSVVGAVVLRGVLFAVFGNAYSLWPWVVLGPLVVLGLIDMSTRDSSELPGARSHAVFARIDSA